MLFYIRSPREAPLARALNEEQEAGKMAFRAKAFLVEGRAGAKVLRSALTSAQCPFLTFFSLLKCIKIIQIVTSSASSLLCYSNRCFVFRYLHFATRVSDLPDSLKILI